MRALAADLPNGLLAGFRAGAELDAPKGAATSRVYAIGMGGSAIAADLARCVVDAESEVALSIVRSAEPPRSLGRSDRALLISYSGETWETLRAYTAAGRAGAQRVVVTSGGSLAERAEEDGVPVLRLPPGMPARAAVGHLLGGLLGLLDPAFPESNEDRVAGISERLRPEIGRYARDGGPAALLADAVGDRLPFVYAESRFLGLARRWKNQLEENAKRVAACDEVPEALHNAIVGWDRVRRSEAARQVVVLLEWAEEEPTVRRGFRFLERLLASRKVPVLRVPLASDDRLEALVRGIALGDQVSLRLAARGRVDPCSVEPIVRLRVALGRAGSVGR